MITKRIDLNDRKLTLIIATCIGAIFFSVATGATEPVQNDINKPEIQELLTPKEISWLNKHKTIRIAGPKAFPPFHYFEADGALKGMASDYMNLIFSYLNIKPEIQNNLAWPEVLKKAEDKEIDLISCSAKTSERESYLAFTDPYLSFPLVIITKVDAPFIGGLADLHGKKTAFIKGAAAYDWIKRDNIKAIPYFVKTPLDALQAVSLGYAEAHIDNLAAASYLIQKQGLSNLKIAAPTSFGNYNLYMAVRKDWPELVSIINKIFPAITPQQHSKIRNSWLAVRYEHGIRKTDVVKWVLGISGIVVAIFFAILLWNRRLNREIHERTQAEEALKAEKEFTASLIDNAPTFFVAIDPHGKTTMMNQHMLKALNYNAGEVIGKDYLTTFVPERERGTLASIFERLTVEHKPTLNENHIISKDGKEFPVEWHGMPVFDANRNVQYFCGIGIDITERRRNEETQRELMEKYRQLVAHAPAGIYEIDMQRIRFTSVNDVMCEYTGYTREELLALDPFMLLTEESQKRLNFLLEEVFAGNENPEPVEYLVRGKNDREFWVLVNSRFFFKNGVPKRATAVVHDLTAIRHAQEERKRLEAQLQQAQKMESIGTLAGGIAHDFNNILSPVIGYTEMLLEDTPKSSPVRVSLNEVLKGAMRARDLVKQILTFSRQTNHEIRPLKVQYILKEALKLSRSTLPTTIQIKQDIQKDCGMIMADPTQVHQIVMNLITNGFHAMEESGGILTVDLKEVDRSQDSLSESNLAPGPYVCLTIADTGSGMDRETRKRLFEPYFTTKERDKGTGLGLAVVHGIVSTYKGTILVESEIGKGAAFKVYIPRIVSTVEKKVEALPAAVPTGSERILLVDDEEPIAAIGKTILDRLGYQVAIRNSSIDTLEAFRTSPHNYDLIITDMTMPNLSGDKLAAEIKRIRPDIPVILCTGFSEKVSADNTSLFGIDCVLMKPIARDVLAKAVRNVLDSRDKSIQPLACTPEAAQIAAI